jgi:hypothetical protein
MQAIVAYLNTRLFFFVGVGARFRIGMTRCGPEAASAELA